MLDHLACIILARSSSVLRSLHVHLIFLHLLLVEQQFISLTSLCVEVLVFSQKQLVIDSCFIEEHTSDRWSVLFTVSGMNCLVNIVSNKVVSIVTLELVKLGNVHLWKMHLLHGLHHHLLLDWLLLLWSHLSLLLLLRGHTHGHLLLLLGLLLLVVATSSLAIVVVLVVVNLIALVVVLVTITVWIVLHVTTASAALTTSSSRLVSSTSTWVLIAVVHVISLSLIHVCTLMHVLHSTWMSFAFLPKLLILD